MDSLSSVSPSIVLPPPCRRRTSTSPHLRRRIPSLLSTSRREIACRTNPRVSGPGDEDEVDRALRLDGTIPGSSNAFVERVSSRAYHMRRDLHQTFDTISYDVLETNPWRETSKPVYVLTQRENQLCTMKTRRNRSEVERELRMLFSGGGKWRSGVGNKAKQSSPATKFQMLVEDIREGVLVVHGKDQREGEDFFVRNKLSLGFGPYLAGV